MNSITITLKEIDLMALQEVVIDDDPAAALAFVKENICPKIPAKGSSPCDSARLNPYLFKRRGAEGV
jgi:hypothetical protein